MQWADAPSVCRCPISVGGRHTQVVIPGGTPLWWPRGYGKAVLHDLHISFTPKQSKRPEDGDAGTDAASEGSEGASATVSRVIKRLGLKWVELKQESLGNDGGVGETFKFLVNGMPIFIKGEAGSRFQKQDPTSSWISVSARIAVCVRHRHNTLLMNRPCKEQLGPVLHNRLSMIWCHRSCAHRAVIPCRIQCDSQQHLCDG